MKKRTIFISILLLSNLFIIPTTAVDATHTSDLALNHIIENVPYISQETSFYCLFACPTMAINYYQVKNNVTLQDVLYASGVGYTLIYSHPSYNRVPIGGNGGAWWNLDRMFLAELFGLTYTEASIDTSSIDQELCWNVCWMKIKENITDNKPVIVQVDPLFLPSFINPVLIELGLEKLHIPNSLLQCTTTGFFHVVLLTGFDETSNTVVYNDPMAALFGHPQEGIYATISIDHLKQAMINAARNNTIRFGSFTDNDISPLNENELFLKAHHRNIEKIKGNPSVYDPNLLTLCPNLYGINVLAQLLQDLEGLNNQVHTALIYQCTNTYLLNPFFNIIFLISDRFFPQIFKMTDWQAFSNYYYQLSVEKHNISQYLLLKSNQFNDSKLVALCRYESDLLQQESMLWEKVSSYFNEFMKKGVFISLPTSIHLLNEMKKTVSNIQIIQESMIQGI